MENKMVRDDDEMEIDLRRLFYALRRKIWLIIAVGLLCACGAAGLTKFFMSPTYTSTSTMLVLTKETTLSSLADLQMGTQLTKDYTVLITSRPVLEKVIENLDLKTDYKALRSAITIDNPSDTRILTISVVQGDPQGAKEVVDELANVASEYVGDKMEVAPPKIIEEGELPIYKTSPSMQKNVMIGLLIGMVFVAGVIVVLEVLNDSIQSEEDVERYLGVPILATVPDRAISRNVKEKKRKKRKAK